MSKYQRWVDVAITLLVIINLGIWGYFIATGVVE